VLATKPEEINILEELIERGEKNGVQRLQILNKEEVFKKEPFLHPDTIAALYSPDAGNLIPYEFTIALAENAVDNGIELKIRREVQQITSINQNTPSEMFEIKARYWEPSTYIKHGKKSSGSKSGNKLFGAIGASIVVIAGIMLAKVKALTPLLKQQLPTMNVTDVWVYAVAAVLFLISGVLFLSSSGTAKKPDYMELFAQASKTVGSGGSSVKVDDMNKGGTGSASIMEGETVEIETYRAKYIINCAGTYSDKISKMIGDDSFKIKPRIGDYLLLRKEEGRLSTHTLFPCPDPKLGKGVLVQTTLWGNLILGPTARDMHEADVASQTADDIQAYILSKCKALVPSFDPKQVFHGFAGARAKSDKGDWIIEPSSKNKNFIQVAGIDSPGLAGSPAVALEVVRLLETAGLSCSKNENFNPYRAPIIVPKNNFNNLKIAVDIKKSSPNPSENIICKCEKVTEAEVVEAIHRSLPIDSTQAIRKRTRAGMGHCQGRDSNYDCECRVAAIIARETGLPVQAVGRRPWPGTSTLSQRWIDDKEKSHLVDLKEEKK
jgi:L-2-hydroxyglutarate oxidase LhgO